MLFRSAIFGSYKEKSASLSGDALSVTILDTFVALMAGLIIIPACFSFGIEPDAGPSLIFITLPNVFNQMAGGRIWGTLFFLFMSFAAISTVIAVFENILACSMDLWKWSRKKAVIVNLIAITLLSVPCVLGFNVLSGFQPLGPGSGVLDLDFANLASYELRCETLVFQSEAHLVSHSHCKKLVIRRLVNCAHQLPYFFWWPASDIFVLQKNFTFNLATTISAQQSANSLNQGRFTAAAAPCQKQHLTWLELQIDIF